MFRTDLRSREPRSILKSEDTGSVLGVCVAHAFPEVRTLDADALQARTKNRGPRVAAGQLCDWDEGNGVCGLVNAPPIRRLRFAIGALAVDEPPSDCAMTVTGLVAAVTRTSSKLKEAAASPNATARAGGRRAGRQRAP